MHLEYTADNDINVEELETLFDDDVLQETPPVNDGTKSNSSGDVSQTKAFAKRLAEEKAKVVNEERENIAKTLGYNSYEELQKSRERKVYEDRGLDPDEISPIVEELVKKRLNDDPRMKELEHFRAKQVEEFGKKELAEITKLTGGEITQFSQLPQDVLDLWKQKGSLKSAYLELKGEELIMKVRNSQAKGSTSHLATPGGNVAPENGKRPLTEHEKKLWKLFNPKMTEEELNKKMVDK